METCKMRRSFEESSPTTCGNLPKSSANIIMMLGGFEKVIGKEEIVTRNMMQDLCLMSADSGHVLSVIAPVERFVVSRKCVKSRGKIQLSKLGYISNVRESSAGSFYILLQEYISSV